VVTDLIINLLAWPTVGVALLVFGFAPGAVLRLIVLAFQHDDPRRKVCQVSTRTRGEELPEIRQELREENEEKKRSHEIRR